jgi:hypothetical protein
MTGKQGKIKAQPRPAHPCIPVWQPCMRYKEVQYSSSAKHASMPSHSNMAAFLKDPLFIHARPPLTTAALEVLLLELRATGY